MSGVVLLLQEPQCFRQDPDIGEGVECPEMSGVALLATRCCWQPAAAGNPPLLATRCCWQPAAAGNPPLLATRRCWQPAAAGAAAASASPSPRAIPQHRPTGYPCINTNISLSINTKRQRYPFFGCPYYLSRQIPSGPADPERPGRSRAARQSISKIILELN
jgi:hypothetical protein